MNYAPVVLNGKTIYGITFEGDTENRLHLAATRKRNYKMLLYKLFVTSAVIKIIDNLYRMFFQVFKNRMLG